KIVSSRLPGFRRRGCVGCRYRGWPLIGGYDHQEAAHEGPRHCPTLTACRDRLKSISNRLVDGLGHSLNSRVQKVHHLLVLRLVLASVGHELLDDLDALLPVNRRVVFAPIARRGLLSPRLCASGLDDLVDEFGQGGDLGEVLGQCLALFLCGVRRLGLLRLSRRQVVVNARLRSTLKLYVNRVFGLGPCWWVGLLGLGGSLCLLLAWRWLLLWLQVSYQLIGARGWLFARRDILVLHFHSMGDGHFLRVKRQ